MSNTLELDLPETVEFINANSLAKCLGISRATVLRWRRPGRLPRAVYAAQNNTLWNVEDIATWHNAGRPINVIAAMDAGANICADADREGISDRHRELRPYQQDFTSDISHLPDPLQDLIRESHKHILICERILNSCAMFVKTLDVDELIAERREQICRDGNETGDTEEI